MAKIERKTQKIFAGNGATDDIAAFGSFVNGTPVYTDDIEALQTTAYTQGWGSAIAANEAPFLEEMNGVQYGLSKQIAYLLQNGVPEYDAGTIYYANTSFCQVDGVIYQSLTDDNIGNDPATDTTNWKVYYDVSNAPTLSGDNNFTGTLKYKGIDVANSYLTNSPILTNCIVSAPNGVATYDGTTITVKAGLQVLISNGRNSDGTLNNLSYTVSEDTAVTLSGSSRFLFLTSTGEVILLNADYLVYDTPPQISSTNICYSPKDNKCYINDGTGSYSEYLGIILGVCRASDGTISEFSMLQSTDLLKRSDYGELCSLALPEPAAYSTYTDLTIGDSGSSYIAPCDGWVTCTMQVTEMRLEGSGIGQGATTGNSSNHGVYICLLPVVERSTFVLRYLNRQNVTYEVFRFYPCIGARIKKK